MKQTLLNKQHNKLIYEPIAQPGQSAGLIGVQVK